MALVGADIEALRTLARALTQAADRLENMSVETTGRLSTTTWRGPDSEHYRSQWQNDSLPQLRNVVAALRTAANTVERNAGEQDQASGATGSGAAAVVGGQLPPSVTAAVPQNFFGNPLQPFTDTRDFLNSNLLWPITWGTAAGQLGLGPVLPLIDALGLAGDTTLSPDDKIIGATHSMTDLAGGLAKAVPGGYWAGVAVAQWGDVAAEVAKADFSPSARQTVGNYIASDPGGAFDAAKDAVLAYVPKLFSNLLP